ncbi:MAG TPA: hypothetical protein VGJ20_30855 [Xanthobacteraceae bacterium]|jgi:hypothetical protein
MIGVLVLLTFSLGVIWLLVVSQSCRKAAAIFATFAIAVIALIPLIVWKTHTPTCTRAQMQSNAKSTNLPAGFVIDPGQIEQTPGGGCVTP